MIARVKRNLGRNFVGALITERESRDGQGFNRLFGPDFQWLGLANVQWVDVRPAGRPQRLFNAQVSRLRATWSFNAHAFARLVGQYVSTNRDPQFDTLAVDPRSGELTGSALLAYKINWQSVLFLGYGDDRESDDLHLLSPVGRQFFAKMSYAFQHGHRQ